jgi:excisionase family DNA binding protein
VKNDADIGQLAVKVPRAARMLDISVGYTYELIKQRVLPAVRIGGTYRIPRRALEDLLKCAPPSES